MSLRYTNDIDNLWSLFEVALALADNDTEDNRQKFSEAYDKVHDQLCIRWNITMGLYWIHPYTFINLDSRNRWFIADVQNMPGEFVVAAEKKLKKVPYAADYLEIKDLCKKALDAGEYKYKNFPDLSYTAWVISEQVNQEKAAEKGKKTSKAEFLKWFMPLLQALRDLGGSATPVEARKKIIENEHLSDEIVSETRGKTKVNKFENEVAFARNYLVGAGYIDKSVRGVWTLTEAGKSVELTAEMASDIFKKGVSDAKSKKTNDSDALADSDVDTVHYWIYAPGQNADKWEECYKNGYMLLGWGEIGDLGVFSSKDEMKQQMKKEYGDSSSYKNSAQSGEKVLIIDAKYYEHSTQVQFDKHTLHSGNLYQIFTYVKNKEYELREKDHTVSGMLLYAKTDEAIYPNNVYQMSGNQITVRTLDLNLPFDEIAGQLNTIAKTHFDL